MKTAFLTGDQIKEMAEAVLTTHEVTPLSYQRKIEVADEYARDEFGIAPRWTALLLAVKLSNLGWESIKQQVRRQIN